MAIGELIEERLTYSVIGAFFEVYNTLGFGFLEHLYVLGLEHEWWRVATLSGAKCVSRCGIKGSNWQLSEST